MIATERASYILNKLRDKNTVSLKEIASELDVSEATVRRDFERLDKEGFVVRVRSGAKRVEPVVPDHVTPLVTSEKLTEYTEEKNAIAKFAAGFVHDGDCVFLDGGTTIAPMIDFIQDKKIKIVTHNLLIPRRLKKMNVDIFLLGGHYTQFHESTMGVYTEKMVSQFHFDHAFFGCSGIELVHQMVYNDDIDTVPVKEVVDPVTVKPFDEELIWREAQDKKLVVTYENHSVINGIGSAVADVLARHGAGVPLLKIGVNDVFGQVGTVDLLKIEFKLTSNDAVNAILAALSK